MNKSSEVRLVVGAMMVLALVTGVGMCAEAPAPAPAEEPPVRIEAPEIPVRPELQDLSGVKGWVVNGEEISMDQVREKALAYTGPYILRNLVAATLLEQEAKRRGITVSDAEVEAKAKQFREENGLVAEATFQHYLAVQQKTLAWFNDWVREYALLEKVLSDQVYVSDRVVERFYNANPTSYLRAETVSYRVMSFTSDTAAQAAMAELRKGKSFQEIAQGAATSPAEKAVAGDLRAYQRGQSPGLPPEIEKALFAAPLNQVVGPLKITEGSQDYYLLFKVEGKMDAHQFTFEEAKEYIRAELKRQKLEQEVYPRWLQTALSGASIEPLKAD